MSDNLSIFNESRLFENTNEDQKNMCLLEEVGKHRKKFLTYKILLQTALEAAEESDSLMSEELSNKIKKIAALLPLDLNSELEPPKNTLGCDFAVLSLTPKEGSILQQKVGQKLLEKHNYVTTEFRKITGVNVTNVCYDTYEKDTVDLKEKLNKEQDKYSANLNILMCALEDALKVRLEKTPEAVTKKIKEIQMSLKMYDLQSKICAHKIRISICNETAASLQAYRKLIGDLMDQEKRCSAELEVLRETKRKYDLLADCPQYKSILKSYVQYKRAVERNDKIHKEISLKESLCHQ